MTTASLPEEPTPEILAAIKTALFVPLTATASAPDRLRERAIYRAIVRVTQQPASKTTWRVEGSGREAEPTSYTLTADSETDIGRAVTALLADGFPDVKVVVVEGGAT